jgi:hypothetical protein
MLRMLFKLLQVFFQQLQRHFLLLQVLFNGFSIEKALMIIKS